MLVWWKLLAVMLVKYKRDAAEFRGEDDGELFGAANQFKLCW